MGFILKALGISILVITLVGIIYFPELFLAAIKNIFNLTKPALLKILDMLKIAVEKILETIAEA